MLAWTHRIVRVLLGLALSGGLATAAQGAVVLQINGSGILTGATGVVVGSATYNVSFQDSDCPSLYSGCNESSDFIFNTLPTALLAAQALLDQVLLDGSSGNFDSNPLLTFGCSAANNAEGFCQIYTAWGGDGNNVSLGTALNHLPAGVDNAVSQGSLGTTVAGNNGAVYAVWTLAAADERDIPEPAGLLLIGLALLALASTSLRCLITPAAPPSSAP